jgi:hypothetical protein
VAGVDEVGEPACAPCAMRWALSLAADDEVRTRVVAALEYGRRLGLDAEWLGSVLDHAKAELWR